MTEKLHIRRRHLQNGNAVIYILLAIFLFGALAFMMMKGSRTSTSTFTKQNAKMNSAEVNACVNSTTIAAQKLANNGCADSEISYNSDGTNSNPGAPTDGSCSIFHASGGGVQPCATVDNACLADLQLGGVCSGMVYVGNIGSRRVYSMINDTPDAKFSILHTNTSTDQDNGKLITDTILNDPAPTTTYPAVVQCRRFGSNYYLPAINEMKLIWTNRALINLSSISITASPGVYYWSSTHAGSGNNNNIRFSDGSVAMANKNVSLKVRCFYSP